MCASISVYTCIQVSESERNRLTVSEKACMLNEGIISELKCRRVVRLSTSFVKVSTDLDSIFTGHAQKPVHTLPRMN